MAKQEAGYMGGFRGRLGTAVGYSWRGTWVMRSRPGSVSNPRTDKQMHHRELFKRMVQTASKMGGAVSVGFREESRGMHMTEYNLFVNRNNDCFELVDNELVIDYEHLRLSGGPVAPVEFGRMEIDGNLSGYIEFIKNPLHRNASSEDVVYVYAYCPAMDHGVVIGMAPRRMRRVNICMPSDWAGLEVYLYGFVTDVAGRASETSYIGHGPVEQHTEPQETASLPPTTETDSYTPVSVAVTTAVGDAPSTTAVDPTPPRAGTQLSAFD